jgi:hypothetical protein
MLIASRNEGRVPNDPEYIKRVAFLNTTPNFKPLIECGFLVDDSGCLQVLAPARPEESREETETETETEKRRTQNATRNQRFEKYLEQFGEQETFDEFADWAQSDRGWSYQQCISTYEQFRDYWKAASGAKGVKADWKATWRNWCRNQRDNGQRKDAGYSKQASVASAVLAERMRGKGMAGDTSREDRGPDNGNPFRNG